MEAILLLATTPQNAYMSVDYMCTDIKANPEADHQLYFSRIMFGGFHISKGATTETEVEPGITRKDCYFTGEHELIIFPANYTEQLEKLKKNKTIVMVKNCMCVAGPSERKIQFRKEVIDWLLDDNKRWDYVNVDLTQNQIPNFPGGDFS